MRLLLAAAMVLLLLRAPLVMDAAASACNLFVRAVLPGLLPYMVLSLMLASRFGGGMPPWLMALLGWGGGSPTGARLLAMGGLSGRQRVTLAVATATMSPMFLLGTCGRWLGSPVAGAVLLASVVLGGALTGLAAGAVRLKPAAAPVEPAGQASPLTLGQAVDQTARTLLLVCGTMALLRVFAALGAWVIPAAALPLTTVLEVTTGAEHLAQMPWPLPYRTAALAGATGFGGLAILLQNRALYPRGLLPLPAQLFWQCLLGAISFLLALGAMVMVA